MSGILSQGASIPASLVKATCLSLYPGMKQFMKLGPEYHAPVPGTAACVLPRSLVERKHVVDLFVRTA